MARKYSDELKAEIKEKYVNGMRKCEISKHYGIPYKSVDTMLSYPKKEKKGFDKSIGNQLEDAKTFSVWRNALSKKLKEEGLYLGYTVVHVGINDFIYTGKSGYNKNESFVDLYNKG